ncbi:UNVERIFIED_CONTAM: Caffeoyl-CoA O-methyltransferase [Sesamum latifolium]|uniref:Caffeoyl-CoA O-methyltransferase n=1 Tax=Sesamum latifolium TaxID=2727402 RepID=A0AAW2VB53_9LAMI
MIRKSSILRSSDVISFRSALMVQPENRGTFDFAFVDADKVNYTIYHERMLELLKPGGVVIYDNTLWGGTVAMPEHLAPVRRLGTRSDAFSFGTDADVQISQVPR